MIFQQCICNDEEPKKRVRSQLLDKKVLNYLVLGKEKIGKSEFIKKYTTFQYNKQIPNSYNIYSNYGNINNQNINIENNNINNSNSQSQYMNRADIELQCDINSQHSLLEDQLDIKQYKLLLKGHRYETKQIKIREITLDNENQQKIKAFIPQNNLVIYIFSLQDISSIQQCHNFLKDYMKVKQFQNIPVLVIGMEFPLLFQQDNEQSNDKKIKEKLYNLLFEDSKQSITLEYREITQQQQKDNNNSNSKQSLEEIYNSIDILSETNLKQTDLDNTMENYKMSFMLSEALVIKENSIENQSIMLKNSYKSTKLFQSSLGQSQLGNKI